MRLLVYSRHFNKDISATLVVMPEIDHLHWLLLAVHVCRS